MLKVSFDFKGSKKREEGLWDIIDGFAAHLGMIGGGSFDTKIHHFDFFYEAHHDCSCIAGPAKQRISPKMRENLVKFVRSIKGVVNVKSESIR